MSYVSAANRPNPVAAMGALGVPAAFAGLLIVGLAVRVVVQPAVPNPDVIDVPIPPPVVDIPEPMDTPTTVTEQVQPQEPTYTAPTRPETPNVFVTGDSTLPGPLVDPGPINLPLDPIDFGTPSVTPRFDPIAASPRGNPGDWVTNNDYRTSWINRGYEGVASFTLNVDASGRVSNCTITNSTGYTALDDATCRLLERRGRFNPAKDGEGKTVAGTYRSSVRWTIPD